MIIFRVTIGRSWTSNFDKSITDSSAAERMTSRLVFAQSVGREEDSRNDSDISDAVRQSVELRREVGDPLQKA